MRLLILLLALASPQGFAGCDEPAPAPVPVVGGAVCGAAPANVRVVQTGMPAAGMFRTVSSTAHPGTVMAFRFNTATGTSAAAASAAIRPGSAAGKTLVISRCPGGPPVSSACVAWSAQAASVRYYTGVNAPGRCVLEPGLTYYANVHNTYRYGDTQWNCHTTYDCQFVYEQH